MPGTPGALLGVAGLALGLAARAAKRRKGGRSTAGSTISVSAPPSEVGDEQVTPYRTDRSLRREQVPAVVIRTPARARAERPLLLLLLALLLATTAAAACRFLGLYDVGELVVLGLVGSAALLALLQLALTYNKKPPGLASHGLPLLDGLLDEEEDEIEQSVAVSALDARLTGVWVKDNNESDSMLPACDIMALNGVVRMAVSLVRGVEIKFSEQPTQGASSYGGSSEGSTAGSTSALYAGGRQHPPGPAPPDILFTMSVFSVVSWFRVTERYILNGPPGQFKRRDLRKGQHSASATVLPDGGVRLDIEWGEPYGGRGYDEFRMVTANELHVVSHLEVHGKKHTYTVVYRRKGHQR